MEPANPVPLVGAEIHGFHTTADLDIGRLLGEASARWFRPNEVHAILSNYHHFKLQPQPVDLPPSGSVLLFDRKMLRHFRKDGYNWKKKKDGKGVQEAHEKLKIGNEERIHVYYARSEDDPSFFRRSYWLLDKNLERIVLVHYRHTTEDITVQSLSTPVECGEALLSTTNIQNGPLTPMNSTSGSPLSDMSGSAVCREEINSGSGFSLVKECAQQHNHELSLHDINTLGWADLVEASNYIDSSAHREGTVQLSGQQMQHVLWNSQNDVTADNINSFLPSEGISSSGHLSKAVNKNGFHGVKQPSNSIYETGEVQKPPPPLFNSMIPNSQVMDGKLNILAGNEAIAADIFSSQNSFGRWNCMNDNSFGSLDFLRLDAPVSDVAGSEEFPVIDRLAQEQIFNITEISPEWAYSTEETKVLVVGFFSESHKHLIGSNIYCVFGEICVAAKMVQVGVYRCTALPQTAGLVNLFLTLDGHTPISQVLSFDYRPITTLEADGSLKISEEGNDKLKKPKNQVQIRLAHLLFSAANTISILSNKIQPRALKEAKKYASITSPSMEKDWISFLKLSSDGEFPYAACSEDLFELFLKNKLQEWLLLKIAEGCKVTAHDSQGQGVIHLCAILDYAWAVRLFLLSGLSLDFRDAFGWTALHWAAYCGREKMVAALLYAGANPSLVTDPTPANPGGYTASDLASKQGYEGLAAYLAEKGLAAHFQAMSLSGNISAPPPSTSNNAANSEPVYSENLSEQELCLKDSLAAYRNAADAADRIQAAFRERALMQQTKAVQLAKPEMEATQIVSALRIQHAFRKYSRRRLMKAAARIQSHFRTWRTRKDFLNMRRQAIRIQAAFRGHQVRRQYSKIMWSVGVLEKAILRWRLKRKGLRGIQTESTQAMTVDKEVEDTAAEEDFFRIGREQAEDRVQRSVVKVQSMFRSYRAQQEYRKMKLTYEQAQLEFNQDDGVGFS